MHNYSTAAETLDLLWDNYSLLARQVDLDVMPVDTLEQYARKELPQRPFRIAAWLARQGYFIAAWSLWEYYARNTIQNLPNNDLGGRRGSEVERTLDLLAANGIEFSDEDKEWLKSANCLRNLIAHNGARVDDQKSESRFERCRAAFPTIEVWPSDRYIRIRYEHVVELDCRIRSLIDQMSEQFRFSDGQ